MQQFEELKMLTKIISPAYDDYEDLSQSIRQSKESFEIVIEFANQYSLVPLLYASLKEKSLFSLLYKDRVGDYLEKIYDLNCIRNSEIMHELEKVSDLIYEHLDVTPTFLNATAALSESHYYTIGQRSVVDIDLLIPHEKIVQTIDLMENIGYTKSGFHDVSRECRPYYRLYNQEKMWYVKIYKEAFYDRYTKNQEDFSKYLQKSQTIMHANVLKPSYAFINLFTELETEYKKNKNDFFLLPRLQHVSQIFIKYKESLDYRTIEHFIVENNLYESWKKYITMLDELFILSHKHAEEYLRFVKVG